MKRIPISIISLCVLYAAAVAQASEKIVDHLLDMAKELKLTLPLEAGDAAVNQPGA